MKCGIFRIETTLSALKATLMSLSWWMISEKIYLRSCGPRQRPTLTAMTWPRGLISSRCATSIGV
eukprot:8256935-Pyramimonas_sp.AAC.1